MKMKMSYIRVNDIFDQMFDENKRLKECLKAMIEYKYFVDFIINKLNSNLDSNESQKFKEMNKFIEEVFKSNGFSDDSKDEEINDFKEICDKTNDRSLTTNRDNISNNKNFHLIETKVKNNVKIKKTKQNKSSSNNNKKTLTTSYSNKVTWSYVKGEYICNFVGCGKAYRVKESVINHIKTHNKKFICDFEGCGYRAHDRHQFINHLNTHKVVKPFQCNVCSAQFSSNNNLKNHISVKHTTSEEPLVCGIDSCDKVFNNKIKLIRHQKFKHLWEKSVFCDYPNCHFKCFYKQELINHKMSHSEERPFVCNVEGCGAAFKTRCTLGGHKKSHSVERKFKCLYDDCNKTFKYNSHLKRHIYCFHSEIPPLSCEWPGCEFTTRHEANLQGHLLTHTNVRQFVCDWPECGKRFKLKACLNKHLRIHRSDKRYACSWPGCQYRCVFGGNLRKHMRVHQK